VIIFKEKNAVIQLNIKTTVRAPVPEEVGLRLSYPKNVTFFHIFVRAPVPEEVGLRPA